MLCEFCNEAITGKRASNPVKSGIRKVRYCSERCNRRAWYMKHRQPKQSIFLGTPQKGIAWEEWFLNKFGGERPSLSHGTAFDFWYKGKRVDFKVSNAVAKSHPWWVFRPGKRRDEVDVFLCVGLINDVPVKIFEIPQEELPRSGCSIGLTKSKWDRFLTKDFIT